MKIVLRVKIQSHWWFIAQKITFNYTRMCENTDVYLWNKEITSINGLCFHYYSKVLVTGSGFLFFLFHLLFPSSSFFVFCCCLFVCFCFPSPPPPPPHPGMGSGGGGEGREGRGEGGGGGACVWGQRIWQSTRRAWPSWPSSVRFLQKVTWLINGGSCFSVIRKNKTTPGRDWCTF